MKITIINLFRAIWSAEDRIFWAPTGNGKIGNINNQLTDAGGSDILIKGIDFFRNDWFCKKFSRRG
jgi:hypothetical protein